MKINFYLVNQPTRRNEQSIYCYIREYNETLAINTKQSINPDLWDADIQRGNPRKTRDNIFKGSLKSLNQFLESYKSKIEEIERIIRSKEPSAGFDVISEAIRERFNTRKTGLLDIYEEFLTVRKKEVAPKTYLKYKHAKELLEEYQKVNREKLNFEKLTSLFFSKFYSFLLDKKNMLNNTANKNIKFIKTFIIWANDNGYSNNTSYKKFKLTWEEGEIIYLTESELWQLYNYKIEGEEKERLERVRDLFLFQCFTGVRYSDIENISREDIKNSLWEFEVQKTKQHLKIPLNSYALSILAKYNNNPQPLPVISNQKMNVYLKELCQKAGLNEPVKIIQRKGNERVETIHKKYEVVGTHTARRTFVSLSLQRGMKPETIMKITGHTTYGMMQRYLSIADSHTRSEMDKTWGPSLRVAKK